jgi:hypothetical protein
MKSLLRLLVGLLVMLGTLLLSDCSPYGCRVTFGNSTCSSSGSGFGSGGSGSGGGGGGGGSNATPAAFVYAVDQIGGTSGTGANGTIDGYDLSTSASSFLALSGFTAPTIPANDPGVGMVVVQKKFVYALFESTDQLYGWSLNSSSGALTALSSFPASITLNLPVVNYNQYNVITDPAGNYLFISNTGLNEVMVFAIDGSSGALTAVSGSPFPTLIEPGNLATDGLGKYLYVMEAGSDHNSGAMEGFSIGSNGALTMIPGSPFTFAMWQLQGEATGKYMIGTTGNVQFISGVDDLNLYVFSINQTNGVLTQVTKQPTTYSPFTIAAQPPSSDGEFVYSFSVNDTDTGYNSIEGFQLNTTTGALTELTNSPFQNVFEGQWGQFDQSGSNLLVYSNAISGNTTLTQLGPFAVDASGNLTQPVSPTTLVTPGYWVVTDP